jgi:hypothetical protein
MNQLKNIKTTDAMTSIQSSNNSIQVFKPEMSKLLDLTVSMINSGEIKTDIEFAKKFMFSFDSQEQFPINLELLVEMKVYDRKNNLKAKLINNFTNAVDYSIKNLAAESSVGRYLKEHGGSNKEYIFTTVDCFKSLCMLANSNIGKTTKQYYLDLEKVFKRYIILEFQHSQNQLLIKDKELQEATKDKNRIFKLHNQMTQKHSYFKFKKGPCFYIVTSGMKYVDVEHETKIGIAGCTKNTGVECPHCYKSIEESNDAESLDNRLSSHRTLWPRLQIIFAVYTPDAYVLEKCMKRTFKNYINPNGHELVYSINAEEIKEKATEFLNMFNNYDKEKNYLIEEDVAKYNENSVSHLREDLENAVKERIEDVIEDKEDEREEIEFEIEERKEEIKTIDTSISELEEIKKNLRLYSDRELKELCTKLGLPHGGVKAKKQDRIKTYLKEKIEMESDDEEIKEEKDLNFCVDCDKEITYTSTRCATCNYKWKRQKHEDTRQRKYCACGVEILLTSVQCLPCDAKNKAVKRPSKEKMIELSKKFSQKEIGRTYGVSASTVRRWKKELEVEHVVVEHINFKNW